ncbi:diphosphoinositol polyphosphate phosphohydrolase 2-like [Diaphorina citri]|uniref:Diphosphoinositol polyphosphate phosphohydrolase 2-like n=1 Tax=Diaphorina citri TaxID=121845 RepID=A0A3Q0JL83_DIACI|nr:diphosphoinositol polyphosphate phosphohydrolase 2-like [Diaphorina citri]
MALFITTACVMSTLILLVTSSRRPEHWIVPGGGVEPEEEPAATALREVAEEAGVLGKLGRSLGVFELIGYLHPDCLTDLTPFAEEAGVLGKLGRSLGVFEVRVRMNEGASTLFSNGSVFPSPGRQRKWFTLDEALKLLRLHKPYQLRYLESMLRPPPASPTPS